MNINRNGKSERLVGKWDEGIHKKLGSEQLEARREGERS